MTSQKNIFVEVPYCIQVQNNKIIHRKAYEEFNIKRKLKVHNPEAEKNLKDGRSSGVMNRFIASKMRRIIRNFVEILKVAPYDTQGYKANMPTFVTLTLSSKQFHTDKEVNRNMLNEFIIKIKRQYGVKNYIWRAERQKNGNIHYHILLDKYVFHQEIREVWNVIQDKNGYIEKFANSQKNKWIKGDNWKIGRYVKEENSCVKVDKITEYMNSQKKPNSTDIHALRNLQDVEGYICKYMSKNELQINLEKLQQKKIEQPELKISLEEEIEKISNEIKNSKIDGRIWGCSDAIRGLKDVVIICDSNTECLLTELKNDKEVLIKEYDTMTIYYRKNVINKVLNYRPMADEIRRYRRKMYYELYIREEQQGLQYEILKKKSFSADFVNTRRIPARQMDLFYSHQ